MNRLSLFHALVSGLTKSEVNFEFRDDDSSNGTLYLFSVEKDGILTYGWGGKTDPEAYARGWIARLNSSQFLNSFNNVEISDGDTVDLYHVQNITSAWHYSRVLAGKDSASVNDEVELLLEQTTCTFSNGEIIENGLQPIENGEIVFNENSFYTGVNGKIKIILETNPPVVFSSENNAVLVKERVTTSAETFQCNQLSIYPNPVKNILNIKLDGIQKYDAKLTNLNGKVLAEKHSQSENSQIDMEIFSPGIYFLQVSRNNKTETFKIIKK